MEFNMDKKGIAIYGGSFNPPLNSHFSIAEQLLNEYNNIEKIIFVPVSTSYPKNGLIDNIHRFNMLKLVCDNNNKFEVSDIEIKSKNQLSTIETMEIFKKIYPNKRIYFIIGTDNLKDLPNWNLVDRLVSEFKIFVVERDNDCFDEIIDNNIFLKNNKDSFIKLKDNIRSNISSSFVRERLKKR